MASCRVDPHTIIKAVGSANINMTKLVEQAHRDAQCQIEYHRPHNDLPAELQ